LPLPDKPSIAVLPFADPSGAVEGDYFADGMVDEIVNALARFPSLFVIASGSSLSYRERERDFKRIGRELGVQYLLEGSVRRSGPRVRVAVDLVEAETGAQIWSERFEGTLEDVFALQDEVANAVAARIEPAIQAADLRRGAVRPTEDLGAHDLFLRAQQRYREGDNAGYQAAIGLFEQAVARDPTFAAAWAFIAILHIHSLLAGWSPDHEDAARKAQVAIRHAMLANDDEADVLASVAFAGRVLGGDRRSSLAMADQAVSLNPGSFWCWTWTGYVSVWCGQSEQALERFQHALRLNPRAPDRHMAFLGIGVSLVRLERFDEAIPWLNEAVTLRPDFPPPLFYLAAALSLLGRFDEASATLGRFEALASLKSWIDTARIGRGSSEAFLSALRRLNVDI
jgi:adenylate cyclase